MIDGQFMRLAFTGCAVRGVIGTVIADPMARGNQHRALFWRQVIAARSGNTCAPSQNVCQDDGRVLACIGLFVTQESKAIALIILGIVGQDTTEIPCVALSLAIETPCPIPSVPCPFILPDALGIRPAIQVLSVAELFAILGIVCAFLLGEGCLMLGIVLMVIRQEFGAMLLAIERLRCTDGVTMRCSVLACAFFDCVGMAKTILACVVHESGTVCRVIGLIIGAFLGTAFFRGHGHETNLRCWVRFGCTETSRKLACRGALPIRAGCSIAHLTLG